MKNNPLVNKMKELIDAGRDKKTEFSLVSWGTNAPGEYLITSGNWDDKSLFVGFAPTTQELINALPKSIEVKGYKGPLTLNVEVYGEEVYAFYEGTMSSGCSCCYEEDKEGYMEGKYYSLRYLLSDLWLWCKEKGHLDKLSIKYENNT